MTLGDIYYVLFRHKWKIILCSTAGVLAAIAFFVLKPPPYQSEASVYVSYVSDTKSLSPQDNDTKVKQSSKSDSVINSEVGILTSLDLALKVVETVGPEKILAKAGGGIDRGNAAAIVWKNLTVVTPKNSSVIQVVFQHPDPTIVQPVLREVIENYFQRHIEVHRAVGLAGDFLTQETDQFRSRLAQTQEELRKAKDKGGVISLPDMKKAYTEEISKVRQELFDTETELAQRRTVLQEMAKVSVAPTNTTTGTQGPADEYKSILGRIEVFQKKEQELLLQFTGENAMVRGVRGLIAENEKRKQVLEQENPSLIALGVSTRKRTENDSTPHATKSAHGADPLAGESPQVVIAALESKMKVLNSQLEKIRAEAMRLGETEGAIGELQLRKDLEETNYKYFIARQEQARIDESLGAGRITNLSKIQSPTPPSRDWISTYKQMAIAIVCGVFGGIAWAFLIELLFDHSVRRSIEIETKLRLPFFLSIPDIGKNSHRRLAKKASKERLRLKSVNNAVSVNAGNSAQDGNGSAKIAPWDDAHLLHPFYEALRDRLIMSFEDRNLTHKPKLVAVTGVGNDAGVTTVAAGLAGCLSETGDGNVLLVDMSQGQKGSAQQFCKGKAVCGLEEALDTKESAHVQDKLYVVATETNGDKLLRALPQRFTNLVPKLKASDYDYIIFDMPPISETSLTPRLAGFMDMVLLVVESEKTDRHVVERAGALLSGSKENVGVVLNKSRTYVPRRLRQEL